METRTSLVFKRMKDARAQFGIGQSTFYDLINSGLMPPGVKLGMGRIVGWPGSELDAIAAARIAGKSDDEIKVLVQKLLADRAKACVVAV